MSVSKTPPKAPIRSVRTLPTKVKPLKMALARFTALAQKGRVGYNPLGNVVTKKAIRQLQKHFPIREAGLWPRGWRISSCYHWILGRAYGYREEDIFRMLARGAHMDIWNLDRRGNMPALNAIPPPPAFRIAYNRALKDGLIKGKYVPTNGPEL